jgi:hypothetical protein
MAVAVALRTSTIARIVSAGIIDPGIIPLDTYPPKADLKPTTNRATRFGPES